MLKKFTITFFLALTFLISFAGDNDPRLVLNEKLAPFYHGVASGDPLQDAVIIWTRVSTTAPSVQVEWEMSRDTSFATPNLVATGSTTTDASKDCTVKIDVTGLESNTFYYYRFKADGKYSTVGRTKTAPTADEVDQLRFASVSCSNFQHGYFNVYDVLKDRNDIDAILHLGDYIYEYGPGEYGDIRNHIPNKEMVELMDYRTRYSQYRLDPMLRDLHQQYPFIVMWDDHESADDSYHEGADNHDPNEGDWEDRIAASAQAYNEWLPIRTQDNNNLKIFRKFSYGDLADIFALDTRIAGRDEQLGFFDPIFNPDAYNDTSRQLLGTEQLEWLRENLTASTAKWKIVAQQVMMSPLKVFNVVVNTDQWDGYPAERQRFFDIINENDIDNVVVLTGDIHTSWAMDLPFGEERYVPSTGENSAAVEFVTTSVTSPGFPFSVPTGFIREENKNIKFINVVNHGYSLLNLDDEKAQNDYYYIKTVEEKDDFVRYGRGYYTENGANKLTRTDDATESIYPPAIFAPDPLDTMITDTTDTTTAIFISNINVTGIFPNPIKDNWVNLQFFVQQKELVTIQLFDMAGQLLIEKELGLLARGIYNEFLELPDLAAGSYNIAFQHGNKSIAKTLIKIE